ncbi:MAG: hypothetical protein WC803_12665 [Sphingomonas sp.]
MRISDHINNIMTKFYPSQKEILLNEDGSVRFNGGVADGEAVEADPILVGGEYNAEAPTYQNGSQTTLQQDRRGNLKTVGSSVYNATAPTLANGEVATQQLDVNGNLKATLATAIAGEDLTNDVLKVEQRYSYAYCVADTLVKTGAGFLHTLTFSPTDAAATAGTIFVYDKTTEATPTIFSYTIPAAALVPVTVTLDVSFTTGLYIGFTTTADVAVTVSYR